MCRRDGGQDPGVSGRTSKRGRSNFGCGVFLFWADYFAYSEAAVPKSRPPKNVDWGMLLHDTIDPVEICLSRYKCHSRVRWGPFAPYKAPSGVEILDIPQGKCNTLASWE
jgi:hypothetical protein